MKFLSLSCALAMLAGLIIPVQLTAQDNHDHKHHHYKLIVLV
jgi:hypothetical protein